MTIFDGIFKFVGGILKFIWTVISVIFSEIVGFITTMHKLKKISDTNQIASRKFWNREKRRMKECDEI